MLASTGLVVIISVALTSLGLLVLRLSRLMYKRRLQQNLKRHIAVYSKTPDTHRSAVRIELPPIDQIPVTEMYVERLQFPYPQTPPPGYEEIPLDDQQATTPYNKKSLKKNRVTFMPDPPSYSTTQQDI